MCYWWTVARKEDCFSLYTVTTVLPRDAMQSAERSYAMVSRPSVSDVSQCILIIVLNFLKRIKIQLAQVFAARWRRSTDLFQWDRPEIPGGIGVGHSKTGFCVKKSSISFKGSKIWT